MSNTTRPLSYVLDQLLPFKRPRRRTAKLLLWAARCNAINAGLGAAPGTNRRQIDSVTRQVYSQLSDLQEMAFEKLNRAHLSYGPPQGTPLRRHLGRAR